MKHTWCRCSWGCCAASSSRRTAFTFDEGHSARMPPPPPRWHASPGRPMAEGRPSNRRQCCTPFCIGALVADEKVKVLQQFAISRLLRRLALVPPSCPLCRCLLHAAAAANSPSSPAATSSPILGQGHGSLRNGLSHCFSPSLRAFYLFSMFSGFLG